MTILLNTNINLYQTIRNNTKIIDIPKIHE